MGARISLLRTPMVDKTSEASPLGETKDEKSKMSFTSKHTVGIHALLDFPGAYFRISLRPVVLENIPGIESTGCLVTTEKLRAGSVEEKALGQVTICDRIRTSWRFIFDELASSEVDEVIRDVDYLLSCRTDDISEIQQARKQLTGAKVALAGADEAQWLFASSMTLRKYALLRRLALPMGHVESGTETIVRLDISFLDLLLDVRDLKPLARDLLSRRISEIENELGKAERTGPDVKKLKQLHTLLTRALERAEAPVLPIVPLNEEVHRESYVVPDRARQDHNAAVEECERLLSQLEQRKKKPDAEVCHYTVGGKVKLPYRIRNGTLLVTEEELSYDEFVRQKKLMEKVNKMLKRQIYPGISRPRMQKASLSDEAISQLRSIFFNEKGCLRKSIVADIDASSKHGYISFANTSCHATRNDYRWQVPLWLHTQFRLVPTRSLVETFLAEHGIIHPEHEKIHDLGILIGGTEDQSLHHDIPRQTTSWLPEDPAFSETSHVPVGGWEYDRAAYNEAMASPYAPSSVLLGMGEDGLIQVGVQKNQIDRTGCADGFCRIVDGKASDQFRIVRENYYLVVLEASPGVIFTGDFQHAGVRNFTGASLESKLMTKFFDAIENILEDTKQEDGLAPDATMEIISMMCKFPNLHKICRFHCSTEPVQGPLRIPRNSVGFVDCRPNPPGDESHRDKYEPMRPASDASNKSSDNDTVSDTSSVDEASVTETEPLALFTTVCPVCDVLIQGPDRLTLDEALSMHIHACENSRLRFRRGAT